MIAVVSDSHIPSRAEEIPEEFYGKMEEADTVVHCGDFATEEFFEEFNSKQEDFYAVKGNCDFFDLPASETFERSGVKFGVYHGTGITPRGDLETLVDVARKLEVDVLLTGHTHEQRAVKQDGVIILNPGSCTGVGGGSSRRGNPQMLTVEPETLEVSLLTLRDGIEEERKTFKV